jgi:hypothetical protein
MSSCTPHLQGMDTDSELPDLVRTRVGDAVASCPPAMALLKEGLLQAAGPGGIGVEVPGLQVGPGIMLQSGTVAALAAAGLLHKQTGAHCVHLILVHHGWCASSCSSRCISSSCALSLAGEVASTFQ